MHFEINLTFLIKRFFYMPKKSRQKSNYLDNENSLSQIIFKGLLLEQIKQIFLEGKSPTLLC